MTIDTIRTYCLNKKQVTESFPFDQNVLVFKVCEKMFLLTGLDSWENGDPKINLKCDPEYAIELRENYQEVTPGFHMNKTHWNTVALQPNSPLKPELIFQLIDHSYDLVVSKLPKKLKANL